MLQQAAECVQFNLNEFQFQLKTGKKLFSGIFNKWGNIHMVSCCDPLCVFVCEYNKQQGCILDCVVQALCYAFDQFAVMGTGLHPDM